MNRRGKWSRNVQVAEKYKKSSTLNCPISPNHLTPKITLHKKSQLTPTLAPFPLWPETFGTGRFGPIDSLAQQDMA